MRICTAEGYPGAVQMRFLLIGTQTDKQEEIMEKYIIAVDMDGTLLNSENKISGRNRNVLQRLIDDGHYVVPATGRTRELIPQEFSVLRGVKWGIVENGCVV